MKRDCNPNKTQYETVYIDPSEPYNRICPNQYCGVRWHNVASHLKWIEPEFCPKCKPAYIKNKVLPLKQKTAGFSNV